MDERLDLPFEAGAEPFHAASISHVRAYSQREMLSDLSISRLMLSPAESDNLDDLYSIWTHPDIRCYQLSEEPQCRALTALRSIGVLNGLPICLRAQTLARLVTTPLRSPLTKPDEKYGLDSPRLGCCCDFKAVPGVRTMV